MVETQIAKTIDETTGENQTRRNRQNLHVVRLPKSIDTLLGYKVEKVKSPDEIIPGQRYIQMDTYGDMVKRFRAKNVDMVSSRFILVVPSAEGIVERIEYFNMEGKYKGIASIPAIAIRPEEVGFVYRILDARNYYSKPRWFSKR